MIRTALGYDGTEIKYLTNPTEEYCKLALNQTTAALQHIKNPSKSVIDYALRINGNTIQYVKNPTPDQIVTAVRKTGCAIGYIKNCSFELWRIAIMSDAHSFTYFDSERISKLTEEQKQELYELTFGLKGIMISRLPLSARTEKLCKIALENDPNAIQYTNHYDWGEEMHVRCVRHKSSNIRFLSKEKQTKQICLIALNSSGTNLQYIHDKTPELCKVAVNNDSGAIQYIAKPSLELLMISCMGCPGHNICRYKDVKFERVGVELALEHHRQINMKSNVLGAITEKMINISRQQGVKAGYNYTTGTKDSTLHGRLLSQSYIAGSFNNMKITELRRLNRDELMDILRVCISRFPNVVRDRKVKIQKLVNSKDLYELQKLAIMIHSDMYAKLGLDFDDKTKIEFIKKHKNFSVIAYSSYFQNFIKSKEVCKEMIKHIDMDDDYKESSTIAKTVKKLHEHGLSDEDILELNPLVIPYVKDQPEKYCLQAVKIDGMILGYVKNKTDSVCIEAVKNDSEAIQYISKYSKKILKMLIDHNPHILESCHDPLVNIVISENPELMERIVTYDGMLIRFISKPPIGICLMAVTQNENALSLIDDFTEEMVKIAIKKDWRIIKMITYLTKDICEIALEGNNEAWYYFNPEFKKKYIDRLTFNSWSS